MTRFFDAVRSLLPDGPAWRLPARSNIRAVFKGCVSEFDRVAERAANTYTDLLPQKTRHLDTFNKQLGIDTQALDEQQKRDTLAHEWQNLSSNLSAHNLQRTLRAHGFDVYVHEAFDPATPMTAGTQVVPQYRDPRLHVRSTYTTRIYNSGAGEAHMQAGEPAAQAGFILEADGYPLANIAFETKPVLSCVAGDPSMQAGELKAQAGEYSALERKRVNPTLPDDPKYWPYFIYIGGANFGELANISSLRRRELERICLQRKPAHCWLAMLVKYI